MFTIACPMGHLLELLPVPAADQSELRSRLTIGSPPFHDGVMHNGVMESGDSGEELVVAFEQLVRYVRQVSTAGGLSPAASSVLSRLGRAGPQRVTELARAEGVSQPGMTQLVSRMERDGLVRRIASTDDRRGVLVEATDTGADVVGQRHAERAEALRELMDRLDPQERSAVLIALPALARSVQAHTSK